MNIDKKALRLYAVTDRTWLDGRTLYDDVEKALKGGVTLLQLREKNMSTDDFINSAKVIIIDFIERLAILFLSL